MHYEQDLKGQTKGSTRIPMCWFSLYVTKPQSSTQERTRYVEKEGVDPGFSIYGQDSADPLFSAGLDGSLPNS